MSGDPMLINPAQMVAMNCYLGAAAYVPYSNALKGSRNDARAAVIVAYVGVGRGDDAERLSLLVAKVRLYHCQKREERLCE